MQLVLKNNLPFTTLRVGYQGKSIEIPNVLVDTGSATTILSADTVSSIHIEPSPSDILYVIRGVGGNEVVFSRRVDYIQLGRHRLDGFEVEVGGMDYGFEINGILGMDYLTQAGAVINLKNLVIDITK